MGVDHRFYSEALLPVCSSCFLLITLCFEAMPPIFVGCLPSSYLGCVRRRFFTKARKVTNRRDPFLNRRQQAIVTTNNSPA